MVRLNYDGTIDHDFQPGFFQFDNLDSDNRPSNTPITSILQTAEGKVLVAGSFTAVQGIKTDGIVRLNSDGTVDEAFKSDHSNQYGFVARGNYISSMAIDGDGNVLVGRSVGYPNKNLLIRLNEMGQVDNDFSIKLGKTTSGAIRAIHIDEQGRILIGGSFSNINGVDCSDLLRIFPTGEVDTEFDTSPDEFKIGGLTFIQPVEKGKILIGGGNRGFQSEIPLLISLLTEPKENVAPRFTRLPVSKTAYRGGSVVFTFSYESNPASEIQWVHNDRDIPGANSEQLVLTNVQPADSGSYQVRLINGSAASISDPVKLDVLQERGNPEAEIDQQVPVGNSFENFWNLDDDAEIGFHLPIGNDRFLLGIVTDSEQQNTGLRLARLLEDGTIDPEFNTQVIQTGDWRGIWTSFRPMKADVSINGMVLFVFNRNFYLVDSNGDGSDLKNINHDFEEQSGSLKTKFIKALADGDNWLIGGDRYLHNDQEMSGLLKMDINGIPKVIYKPFNRVVCYGVALDRQGRILIGGRVKLSSIIVKDYVVRLKSDTAVDSSFLNERGANDDGSPNPYKSLKIKILKDGKILVFGSFTQFGGKPATFMVRLLENGKQDPLFNTTGLNTETNGSRIYAVGVQSDGRILIGGKFGLKGESTLRNFYRLLPDGSLDPTFDHIRGMDGPVESIHIDSKGRTWITGDFKTFNGTKTGPLVRLHGSSPVPDHRLRETRYDQDEFKTRILSESGKTYRFLYSNSPESDQWLEISEQVGDGTLLEFVDDVPTDSRRFYRIEEE